MISIHVSRYSGFLTYQDEPAGRMAFDSSTICVVRSEASTDGCAWGSARLKLDLVAMFLAEIC